MYHKIRNKIKEGIEVSIHKNFDWCPIFLLIYFFLFNKKIDLQFKIKAQVDSRMTNCIFKFLHELEFFLHVCILHNKNSN